MFDHSTDIRAVGIPEHYDGLKPANLRIGIVGIVNIKVQAFDCINANPGSWRRLPRGIDGYSESQQQYGVTNFSLMNMKRRKLADSSSLRICKYCTSA